MGRDITSKRVDRIHGWCYRIWEESGSRIRVEDEQSYKVPIIVGTRFISRVEKEDVVYFVQPRQEKMDRMVVI